MKRRILSITLVVCIMIGFCIPAWADEISKETGITDSIATGGSVETTLTGTFSYTNIKVTIPTSVQFTLDPTKTITKTTPTAQVTGGGTFVVSNYSNVPLYLHVRKISCSGVTLTSKLSDITDTSKKMYFTMYADGDSLPDLTAATLSDADYLSVHEGMEVYKRYLVTKNGIDAGSLSSPVTKTCYVAARAGLGFASGDSFEIKVTFVVSQSAQTRAGGSEAVEPE